MTARCCTVEEDLILGINPAETFFGAVRGLKSPGAWRRDQASGCGDHNANRN